MKLKIKLYTKHNYYTIYGMFDTKEYGSGHIDNRDVAQIIKDNDFEIENLWLDNSYSYGITIYGVEVK